MSYNDIYIRTRSKPSFILILLALIAVGGFIATFLQPNARISRASKHTILNHLVVNLSARQAGIYYQTDSKTTSWVLFGKDPNNLDRSAFDDRDTESNKSSTLLHFIPLSNLQEDTTYYYKIIADGEVLKPNNSSTFTFKTAHITVSNTSIPPAYGKVVYSNNQAVNNAFVLYYYPDAYPLVTAIKGGDWLISLNTLINRTTGKLITPNTSEKVKIELLDEGMKSTSIETELSSTTPLSKTVILGSKYSVEGEDKVLSASISASISPSISKIKSQSLTSTNIPEKPIELSFPREDAVIPGKNPLIKGLAVPNNQVTITLIKKGKGTLLTTKATADSTGNWRLNLPMALEAGSYTITMSTKNSSGLLQNIQRNFTTTKSGEEVVLGTATSEATLTPQPTLVESPTESVATPYITLPPTATATPKPPPPVTGENNNMIIFGSAALIIIGAGVLMLL